MPTISLKGTTGTTKSKRVGNTIVVEKTIEKALLKETHQGQGRRVTGKQAAQEIVTFSAKEVRALSKEAETKADEKIKKHITAMNISANKAMQKMETTHRKELKTATDQLAKVIEEKEERDIEEKERRERERQERKEKKEKKERREQKETRSSKASR